ncbi:MAG: DUF4132 domain-containing protein [Actinomycetota bacterium]|nr:DUF4132 domain-containing protein [Actinomycetota bacterium]
MTDAAPIRGRVPLADPRVETLVAWAQTPGARADETVRAAIEALTDAPPRGHTAAGLSLATAAAYARVAGRGPRDLQAGHRIVKILARLGEPGTRELVQLRERVRYQHPRQAIDAALVRLERELRVPLGELEDAFDGPAVDADLRLTFAVGLFQALVSVSDDLRRVQTRWRGLSGEPMRSRPARAGEYPDAISIVHAERRRLQTHISDLRTRLEAAMVSGRSWSAEEWAVRMFADPLRAAMARRLVWRFETAGTSVLALASEQGLEDVDGRRVDLQLDANVELWHPAESPDLQEPWRRRATAIGLDQPVDQISREIILAGAKRLSIGRGTHVNQRGFRGFLMRRGWNVPYLGPWFTVPEATRELTRSGPVAVLHLDHASAGDERVVVMELAFRSVHGCELDARELPTTLVSEAARDVLGAAKAGGHAVRRQRTTYLEP